MGSIGTTLRRTIFFVMLAAGIGAAVSWRRGHPATPTPREPPEWPPVPARSAKLESATPAVEPGWLPALNDGSAPASHPIKANDSSKIFHVPGGRFYDRTRPERCYATAAHAEADGYRRSKS